jgi:Flp pilus assembly protein TadG
MRARDVEGHARKSARSRGRRGASMVEYALLLVGVMILAAFAVKLLGPKVNTIAVMTEQRLT